MAVESKAVAVTSQPEYKLDPAQTTQACKVLLRHIADKQKHIQSHSSKRNLLAQDRDDSGDDAEETSRDMQDIPIWLVLSTKKHITDQKRLKPSKISLPHPINDSELSTVCIITADPQNTYTSLIDHPSFPSALRSRISRVISLSHLKKDYKSFESRRKLLAEHDIFLADDRIVTYLPGALGKVFYKGSTKRPVPIGLSAPRERDENGKRVKIDPASGRQIDSDKIQGGRGARSPEQVSKEIEKALRSALVNLAPATTTAIKVARADFTPEMVYDNVNAVVEELTAKFVPQGWRNVRAVHIKDPNSMAFPIWLASELWVDEEDVLEEKKMPGNKVKARSNKNTKSIENSAEQLSSEASAKRKSETTAKPDAAKHAKKKRRLDTEDKLAAVEATQRQQKLKKQKAEAMAESF